MLERALSSLSRPSLAAHWVSSLPFFPSLISYPIPPSLALPWSDYSVRLHPRSHTACLASRAACAYPFPGLHTACLASRAVCACSLVPTAAHRMPRLTYCMHVLTPMPAHCVCCLACAHTHTRARTLHVPPCVHTATHTGRLLAL